MVEQKIQIVRVTTSDYNKVMDIFPPSEIYEGTDYLPDYFHLLLDMQNVEAYAVVADDKFVSFELFMVVDDGKTVISRAGRTRKGYTDHGYIGMIFEWFNKVSPKRRNLVYQASTGGSHVLGLLRKLERGIIYKVLQKEFRSYTGSSTTNLSNQLQGIVNNNLSAKLISEADLGTLLSNHKLCRKLFPEGRIIVDWVPYRPIKSNAPLMKWTRTYIVASELDDVERCTLTFVSYFQTYFGLVCNLDVYGHIDSTLKTHLYLHLKSILPFGKPGNILIRCFCKDGDNWNVISPLMEDFGLEERVVWGSGLICSEAKLEELKDGNSSKL